MSKTPTTVTIPATIEEATSTLEGIEALLTAKGWERAAIVYAFTHEGTNQHDLPDGYPSGTETITAFVARGIAGLTTRETVAVYRDLWAKYGDTAIKPGDTVKLPKLDFPPQKRNLGSRVTASSVAQAVKDNPEIAKAAADNLPAPYIHAAVAERSEVLDDIASDDRLVGQINVAAARHHGERLVEEIERLLDFDRDYQDAAAQIVYREADRAAGRWTPNEQTKAMRHFLVRALTTPEDIDPVLLIAEIEAHLKEEAAR